MSQAALSYETRINYTHISKMENGREDIPPAWAEKLSEALCYDGDPADLSKDVEA